MSKSPVENVIEAACRRRLLVTSIEHSAVALSAVLAGFILLLLLGTQILNWPWLVLLAASGSAIALERIRRAIVSRYRVAQIIDGRLQLHDSLSTAWFLLQDSERRRNPFGAAQIERAETIAARVEPPAVFPLVWRRSWTLACALAAVAFGLFALRYLVTNSLSLHHALLPMPAFSASTVMERLQQLIAPKRAAEFRAANSGLRERQRGDGPVQDRARTEPGESHASGIRQANAGDKSAQQYKTSTDRAKSPSSTNADERPTRSPDDAHKAPDSPNRDGGGKNPQEAGQQPKSSLADRMHDAFSGLMEKLRPQSGSQASRDHSGEQSKSGERRSGSNSSDSQTEAASRQDSEASNRDQNKQMTGQQQASEKSAAPQDQAAGQGSDHKASDPHSGIGRQDGQKSLKEAEQLRAMGKLDEIIGKRSATLTGDMTLETQSSRQQLQTEYSGRIARHSDLGGVIQRDEVPPALQNYVREYMEQVHKQANGNQ